MNRIRWAPWPWGGAYRVRVTSSPGRWGTVSVIWQGGPLKGRPATLLSRSLRAHRRDAEAGGPPLGTEYKPEVKPGVYVAGSSPSPTLDYNEGSTDWSDLE